MMAFQAFMFLFYIFFLIGGIITFIRFTLTSIKCRLVRPTVVIVSDESLAFKCVIKVH